MAERIVESPVSDMDKIMLGQAGRAAVKMLGLPADAPAAVVHDAIDAYLEKVAAHPEINKLGEDGPMALGALWGQTICREFDWEWIRFRVDECDGIGITDKERMYLALPLNYFSGIFGIDPKHAALSSIELYNCIKANNLPQSDKRAYVVIADTGGQA